MDIAHTRRVLTLAALAFIASACWARPLLVAPKHLELPLPANSGAFDPEYGTPAIDGNTVLVAANRAININNDRVAGVYIFQRATNGNWNYAGPLVEGLNGSPVAQRQPRHGPHLRRSPGVCTGGAGLVAGRDHSARPVRPGIPPR